MHKKFPSEKLPQNLVHSKFLDKIWDYCHDDTPFNVQEIMNVTSNSEGCKAIKFWASLPTQYTTE